MTFELAEAHFLNAKPSDEYFCREIVRAYHRRISELKEETERMKKQMQTIIAQFAHTDDEDFDDWLACTEETIRETAEMLLESGTPYGCKCKTLHHRVTGDGCHICNPPDSGEKGEA